jgi:glutamine amidotransferase
MLALLDYGIGNIRSLEKAFEAVGARPVRTSDPADVAAADRVVVPGVGAFGACAAALREHGLWQPVLDAAASGTPLLGVCVGMQLLFEGGEEHGAHAGLGLLPGRVVRFPASDAVGARLKVPHMGWNTLDVPSETPLLAGLDTDAWVYFVHSYHATPAEHSDVLAWSHYGGRAFPAVVGRGNVTGAQFHPEKSQAAGLRLLRNFAELPIATRV